MVLALMLITADLAIIFFAIVTALALLGAFFAFASSTDKVGRFERCYATVNARITEGLFWFLLHLWKASVRRSAPFERILPAFFAGTVVVVTSLIPVAAMLAAQRGELHNHGVAAAIGALAWSCILEGTTLPARTKALARREVWPVRLWMAGVALAVLDVAVVLVGLLHSSALGSVGAGLTGAAFVAGADIISLLVGFVLCPWEPYPLLDP
jgi:hypothetical protein